MTAYPPYQAYPGPAPVLITPPPVLVVAADPAPQRRVTVFFRLILAIPHLFLLYWLYLAAGIVAFIGWWVALFTGRLPQFAVTYLSGVLRWTARVYAYDYLLTDAYPPFTFDDDPTYPVRVAIPEPQRLNRAAVFFRYFLILPVGILAGIVISGASTLMSFIAWLIALVAGQLPPSLYLAYVAVVRFQTRYYAYWWMLTPAYPGGLYGDKPGSVAWADQLPTAPAPRFATPQGYGAPQGYDPSQGYGTPGYGAPAGYGAPSGYGAPDPGYGAPAGYGAPGGYGVRPLFQPATWLLPLTTAAKKLVTTFIVLGSLTLVGYIALYAALIGSTVSSTENAVAAANQLNSSYTTLTNSLNAWDQASTNCKGNLACVTKEDGKAASAFNTFSSQLANTSVPAGAAADKARLSAAAATSAHDFIQLSKTTSISQYQSTIASTGLQRALSGFDQDFTALITQLQTY
ncbi:MAG: hypothetical protein JWO75_67 [Actinomycetia bacterium]|nr:hypothetical protein [Actinomycetes bacterium]